MNFIHLYIKKNHPLLFRVAKKTKKYYLIIKNNTIYFGLYPPAYVLSVLKIDLLSVNVSRIGHLTFDAEAYIKEKILNGGEYKKPLLLAPHGTVANSEFLKYLEAYVRLVRNRFLCWLLRPLFTHPICSVNSSRWGEGRETFKSYAIYAAWENAGYKPLSVILPEHSVQGEKILRELGVPENSWYVCIHNRESGYSGNTHDYDQEFRNGKISSYELAIEEVINRGGWCIRMGDPTMEPVLKRDGLIDYAHSPLRSEVMDIYLCATAKAFLGSSSGLALLATYFNVPVACANMIPLANSLMQGKSNITIPKLVILGGEQVPFRKVLNLPMGSFRTTTEFIDSGYQYQDNTQEEILDLLKELLGDIDIKNNENYNKIQNKFRSLIEPHHWCYHGTGRLGFKFLQKYEELL